MNSINKYLILFLMLFSIDSYTQDKTPLVEINAQIWANFSNAFDNLDIELFESIHHKDFLRVSGNSKSIKSRKEYLGQYRENWNNTDRKLSIQFRFLERIYSNTHASERGIYKLTVNPGTNSAQSYYGKFHVLMKKEADTWQFIMDYDSDENKTIGEDDFKNAHGMDEFDKY